jgi:hypothetical protein
VLRQKNGQPHGRRGKIVLPAYFQQRANRVLTTAHKNVRHLRDLLQTPFTIEVVEATRTKPNVQVEALPSLSNSAPAHIPAL